MARSVDLVMVSSVHWHFTWQRHHEIARGLSGRGYRVHFVEPIPKRWPRPGELSRVLGRLAGRHAQAGLVEQPLPDGVTLVNPKLVPDVGALGRYVNRRLLGKRQYRALAQRLARPRVVLHYLPLAAAIDLQRELDPDLSVYDCVWDWSNDPYSRSSSLREDELLAGVDMVMADSPYLFERASGRHRDVHRVLPAVDLDRWSTSGESVAAPDPEGENADPVRAAPRIAYFGAVGENIDLELLVRLSREFRLRLIGPLQMDPGPLASGTELVGPVAVDEVPSKLAGVDVLVLPYRTTGHARGVIPAKTFECLATGLPVVASGLDSLGSLGDLFRLVSDADAFVSEVRAAAIDGAGGRGRRLAAAAENSWPHRIDQIDRLLRERLDQAGVRR